MRRVLWAAISGLLLMSGVQVARAATASAEGPFTEVVGFAIKTGFRGVFTWQADGVVDAVVHYGTSPERLDQSVPAIANAPDRAGLAIATNLEIGRTYWFQVEDRLTGETSAVHSFDAANAWNAWDEATDSYTINMLVQLSTEELPPEVAGDQALSELSQGMSIFAERVYDATDGYVRIGKVLVTDTNLDYAANVPFVWPSELFVNPPPMPADCEDIDANLADVLVETAPPADSHTWAGFAIEKPCTSFYVGRMGWLRVPSFQWRSDLDFAATSTHELSHYAFNAPDLYTLQGAGPDDPDCRNVDWDGSLMHNTGRFDLSAGRWYMTELDRSQETTPCQMGGEPFTWQVMTATDRYDRIPSSAFTSIDHVIDTRARGNEDGGRLELLTLDREPGASTLSTFTANDDDVEHPPPCGPETPQLDDPVGDNSLVRAVEDQPTGGPATDVDWVKFEAAQSGTVSIVTKVAALEVVPDPGSNGEFYVTDFRVDGVPYSARIDRVLPLPESFTVTTPSGDVDVTGEIDPETDSVRIDIPTTAVPWRSGALVDRISTTTYVVVGAVGAGSDEGEAACSYRVGQEDFPTNTAPVAIDDESATAEDAAVVIPVLANDSDVDGDELRVYSVGTAKHGSVGLADDGRAASYLPAKGWSGTDSFTYTVYDGHGGASTAEVAITVSSEVDGPDAVDDAVVTLVDQPTRIRPLANDGHDDGREIRLDGVVDTVWGAATSDGDGIAYTPPRAFSGRDRVTYRIVDDAGRTAQGTITVSVLPEDCTTTLVEALPDGEAGDGWTTENEDTAVLETVDVQPWAPTPDPLASSPPFSWFSDATSVTALNTYKDDRLISPPMQVLPGATLSFRHRHSFEEDLAEGNGPFDGGVLEVSADGGQWSDAAPRIREGGYNGTIFPGGDNVLAGRRAWTGTTPRMSSVVVDLSDLAGQTVMVRWRLGIDGNYISPTPVGAGWWVDDIQVTNLVGVCELATPPKASDDDASVVEDGEVTVPVLENDVDTDGDQLSIVSVSSPSHGSAFEVDGKVRYEPAPDFAGNDEFVYTIADGRGGTSSARVSIAVSPVNDAPIAVEDIASTTRDRAVTIDVLANDRDVDGDAVRLVGVTKPSSGSASIVNGRVRYVPKSGFTGTVSFASVIEDVHGARSTGTVTVTITKR